MISTNNKPEKTPIGLSDLYELQQITMVAIRPFSDEIFFVINQVNNTDNGYRETIWRHKDKTIQFTQGLPMDTALKWSPDGKTLAFLSVRSVVVKAKQGKQLDPTKPQIYLIPYNGGEGIQLTNLPNGVSPFFEWSKDGKKIIFISRMNKDELVAPTEEELKAMDPDEVIVFKANKTKLEEKKVDPRIITREVYRSGTSFFDDRKGQIHVIDVDTKKVERWTNSTEDDYSIAFLTPDNSYAVSTRQKPGAGDETRYRDFIKVFPDGKVEEIIKDHYQFGAQFYLSHNGKYFVTEIGNEKLGTLGQTNLCLYEIETKSKTILTEEIDNSVYLPKWSKDNEYIYYLVFERGTSAIWRTNISSHSTEKVLEAKDKLILMYDLSDDGEWIAYQAFNVNDPSRLYKYHISTKSNELLYTPNKEFLDKKKLGITEEILYDGYNNDFKIQGWILTPPDFDPEKKYPLALNMHGGPHVMWSCHLSIPMFHEFQLLAAEGYVVFYCNPRGSDGYGQKFYQACEKAWGDADSQDILLGVDLVIKRKNIDPKRMAITGGSYGGFLTAWIIGHDTRFTAAVPQRGVYFLSSFWATTDSARILIDDEFGTTPLGDHKFLWERSPAAYAKNIKTPTRIIHSDLDYRAPIPDAEMLYIALKREQPQLDVEFIRYPGEGHELSRSGQPDRRLDRLDKIVEWFDKYCQPQKYKQKKTKQEKVKQIKDDFKKKMHEKIKALKNP